MGQQRLRTLRGGIVHEVRRQCEILRVLQHLLIETLEFQRYSSGGVC